MILTNSISAVQIEINEISKKDSILFETNKNSIDLMTVLDSNMSVTKRKEIITEKSDINYMVTYKENPNLPKDEQVIIQEGKIRKTRDYKSSYI